MHFKISASVIQEFKIRNHQIYSYQTSFGQKYDHFSLLCKQMDIYLRKVYVVRKVTSAPTFLA